MRDRTPVDETRAAARLLVLLAVLALLALVGVHRLAESTPAPWNGVGNGQPGLARS